MNSIGLEDVLHVMLLESSKDDYEDALDLWSEQADEEVIEMALDAFKAFTSSNRITGDKSKIEWWVDNEVPFDVFESFLRDAAPKESSIKKKVFDIDVAYESDKVVVYRPETKEEVLTLINEVFNLDPSTISDITRQISSTYIGKLYSFYIVIDKKTSSNSTIVVIQKTLQPYVISQTKDKRQEIKSGSSEVKNVASVYKIPLGIFVNEELDRENHTFPKTIHRPDEKDIKAINKDSITYNLKAIHTFLKYVVEGTYGISKDGKVHVNGSVDMSLMGLKKIPVKFVKVTGDFNCFGNELVSLEGCPDYVGGEFFCSRNKISSLKGGPTNNVQTYICSYNPYLTSLRGSPDRIKGSFICSRTAIKTFEGGPSYVGKTFMAYKTPIVSLSAAPSKVGRNFLIRSTTGIISNLQLAKFRFERYGLLGMDINKDISKRILNSNHPSDERFRERFLKRISKKI